MYEKIKKRLIKNIEFSSDFIIGYPGESNQDYKDTLRLINKINFINSYSFIYSPRPGTAAANLGEIDKVEAEKKIKDYSESTI